MKLKITDVDEWKPADWANYAKAKLEQKGIEYKIQQPFDFIMMGKLLKDHRKRGGTNFLIKQKIDAVFENFNLTSVNSLQFLYSLAKPEKEDKPKVKKLKDEDIHISDELKQRLIGLQTLCIITQTSNGKSLVLKQREL